METIKGTVKFFNAMKGFGFIEGEDGIDYFVHHTQVEKGAILKEGDKVDFMPVEGDRGKQAKVVKKI